jgi:hypothetical protein
MQFGTQNLRSVPFCSCEFRENRCNAGHKLFRDVSEFLSMLSTVTARFWVKFGIKYFYVIVLNIFEFHKNMHKESCNLLPAADIITLPRVP